MRGGRGGRGERRGREGRKEWEGGRDTVELEEQEK